MRFCTDRRPAPLLCAAFLSPIGRLDEAPVWGKIAAGLLAGLQLVLGAPLLQLLLLLSAMSLLDYLLGAEVARRRGEYDPHLARAGMIGKASGVVLAFVVWVSEVILANAGLVDTHGALATALAVALLAVEIESYDRHREALTGKPTPLLRPVLEFLRVIAEGAFSRSRGGGES